MGKGSKAKLGMDFGRTGRGCSQRAVGHWFIQIQSPVSAASLCAEWQSDYRFFGFCQFSAFRSN